MASQQHHHFIQNQNHILHNQHNQHQLQQHPNNNIAYLQHQQQPSPIQTTSLCNQQRHMSQHHHHQNYSTIDTTNQTPPNNMANNRHQQIQPAAANHQQSSAFTSSQLPRAITTQHQQQMTTVQQQHNTSNSNNNNNNSNNNIAQLDQRQATYSQTIALGAPPTPPSDEPQVGTTTGAPTTCLYVSPTHHQQHQTRLQTGAWVMQATSQTGQQHQQVQQQPNNRTIGHHQHQAAGANCNGPLAQSCYYYDIDDGFSDIMSAPPTPEPQLIIQHQQQHHHHLHNHHHHHPHHHQHQHQHQENYMPSLNNNSHQAEATAAVQFMSTTGSCHHNQDPYQRHQNNQQHQHQHHNQQLQQQQQQQQQQQVQQQSSLLLANYHDISATSCQYTAAMSPDSLSTTSSSPSDNSLYQASPPIPRCNQLTASSHQFVTSAANGPDQTTLDRKPIVLMAIDNDQKQQQQLGLTTSCLQQQQPTATQATSQPLRPIKPMIAQATAPQSTQVSNNGSSNNNNNNLTNLNNVATQRQQQTQPPTHLIHHHRSSPIHLWEFLKELLQQVDSGGCADTSVIRWLDRQKGVFKIEDSVKVAKLWGKRKNKPKMNYDKLSRSIRQYYKKGIMKKTDRSQRLVYQFCSAYCH